jgi:predicted MFS family arabinose efflux permease
MRPKSTFKRRLIDAGTMFLVSGLSLLLLMYVGFGEAQRTFEQFHIEKLAAQARVVQNAMETFLRPGLPMRQFVGFATLTEPILASDQAIAAMTAFDRHGQPVFVSGEDTIALLPSGTLNSNNEAKTYDLRKNQQYFQVILPLQSRFEQVGDLAISMPRSVVTQRVQASFQPLLFAAIGLSAAFALFASIAAPKLRDRRIPWLQIVYGVTFLVMAAVVIGTLISLYADGAQAKTKALANSLGQRLSEIVEFNLNIDEIYGLDRIFGDYSRLNPDISAAGLSVNGVTLIHTDSGQVGRPWVTSNLTYEYVVHLTPPDSVRDIRVAVAVPTNVVLRRIVRSIKNFTALFVASAFLAGLFLQLAGSVQRSHDRDDSSGPESASMGDDDVALDLVKPVFFVAIFLEHLNYAFLPQFMYQVVAKAGLSEGYASAPFMAYYLCFALALVPSGHFAQHRSARPLMFVGLALAGAGLMIMATWADFYIMLLARSTSGIGQGMLFIGVQSYILTMASPDKKTRGAAIIVLGFQGGMISGMAIGSLLVTYMGPMGIFNLSGMIAFILALYAIFVVPVARRPTQTDIRVGFTLSQLANNLGRVLRSLEFLKTMFLIGIPAKAVLTGVVIFALPLLLAQKEYAQEDIGQIIMVYAAGVVLASTYVSRLVDRTGQTYAILFWGAAISGVGLLLIGLIDLSPLLVGARSSTLVTVTLIIGVATVGIAHGFINAPVVTHVADSELAAKIGASSLTATYRFLERLGHIAGPIIVGQLFVLWGQNAGILAWIGVAILLCGLLFLFPAFPGQDKTANRETVR